MLSILRKYGSCAGWDALNKPQLTKCAAHWLHPASTHQPRASSSKCRHERCALQVLNSGLMTDEDTQLEHPHVFLNALPSETL